MDIRPVGLLGPAFLSSKDFEVGEVSGEERMGKLESEGRSVAGR